VRFVKAVYQRVPGLKPTWRWVRGTVVGAFQAMARRFWLFAERHPSVNPRFIERRLVNRFSRRPVVSAAGSAVVSGTTHGDRIGSAHFAIESIAAGRELPRRLILWLDDPAAMADLPKSLRRLQARGLEILPSENYGVHTKFYPYVKSVARHEQPVVTYDDDLIYPEYWLANLLEESRRTPDMIVVYRSHVIEVDGDVLAPYQTWRPCQSTEPSLLNFCTAVSGQVLPTVILNELKALGEGFREVAPKADDIWVHSVAVRLEVPVRQVSEIPLLFPFVPGTQEESLYYENVFAGGNDVQIAAAYGPAEVEKLRGLSADRLAWNSKAE
jgi:hypothetical protein